MPAPADAVMTRERESQALRIAWPRQEAP
jgi:hypothetical protein